MNKMKNNPINKYSVLKKKLELLETTFDNISDAVFLTDNKGDFSFICGNVRHIFKYSKKDVLKLKNISKLLGPDLFDLNELFKLKELKNIEREILDKDGKSHLLLINIKNIEIAKGTVLITCHDITEKTQIKDKLNILNLEYSCLFEVFSEAIIIVDTETGHIIKTNKTANLMYKFNDKEFQKLTFNDLWVDKLKCEKALKVPFRTFYTKEYQIKKDGKKFPAEISADLIKINNKKVTIYAIKDISEIVKSQEALSYELYVNSILINISKEISSPFLSFSKITETVHKASLEISESKFGYVSSIDKQTGDNIGHTLSGAIKSRSTVKNKNTIFKKSENGYIGLWGHSLNTKKGFYTNNPSQYAALNDLPKEQIKLFNFLSVPAIAENRLVGQITLANSVRDYTDFDLKTIEQLAQIYAIAILRKDSNENVIASEEKFRNIFNSGTNLLFITNIKTKIIEANQTACEVLGYNHTELLTKKIADILYTPEMDPIDNKIDQLIQSEQLLFGTYLKTSDGKPIPIEAHTKLIKYNNQNAFLSIVTNLTEKKDMQSRLFRIMLETEEKERERFAQDLHDGIGSILSGINLYLDLAKNNSISQKEKTGYINYSINLITEAIKSSKEIANNLIPSSIAKFGLINTIENFCEKIEKTGKIKFTINYEKKNYQLYENFDIIIYRIMQELVNNTIKYSNASEISIKFKNSKKSCLEVTYQDNGNGFNFEEVINNTTGNGIKNIINRIVSMKASYSIYTYPGKGFKIDMEIPILS